MKKKNKIEKVMKEFKKGELKTTFGTPVVDKKQALAIALSEGKKKKKK